MSANARIFLPACRAVDVREHASGRYAPDVVCSANTWRGAATIKKRPRQGASERATLQMGSANRSTLLAGYTFTGHEVFKRFN